MSNLSKDLISAIDLCFESWRDDGWKLKTRDGKVYNQYILSAYDEMLWMLALGFLLNIENEIFLKLVKVIDWDGIKDKLFEIIIKAKLPDRDSIKAESYSEYFNIPNVFKKLREAVDEKDKLKAEQLVGEFIRKDWFNNHKSTGWAMSHRNGPNNYFGYWSFETTAVIAILDLDDNALIDAKYYAKDMVNYYRTKE